MCTSVISTQHKSGVQLSGDLTGQVTELNTWSLTHLHPRTVLDLMYQKILLPEVSLPTFKATKGPLPRMSPMEKIHQQLLFPHLATPTSGS